MKEFFPEEETLHPRRAEGKLTVNGLEPETDSAGDLFSRLSSPPVRRPIRGPGHQCPSALSKASLRRICTSPFRDNNLAEADRAESRRAAGSRACAAIISDL